MKNLKLSAMMLMVLFAITVSSVQAAKYQYTSVYVSNMHCANCAKKIVGKIYTVPGVVKASVNIKANRVLVTPQKGTNPSPKALWESVEKAGFKPVKISSPYGTFVKKPNI